MLALRLAVLLSVVVALIGTTPVRAADPVETRVLLRFDPRATDSERLDALRTVGGYIDEEIAPLGITRVVIRGDELALEASAVELLSRHPAVEWAEPDSQVRLAFTPNDPFYTSAPDLSSGQWGIRSAFVDRAWDVARGRSTVTVAVLDTGIDPTHPELISALVPGNTFVTTPGEDCTPGTTRDDNSHGTHVAGIIGASGDNGQGIAGVAYGVRLMPVKVLDCTGQGNLSDVASGLVWAVDNGAKIINLSLGSVSDSSTLRSAVGYASERGVLVVSASGNCGASGDKCLGLNQLEYPAAYPEVLAVAATDEDDSVAFFSTRNSSVDVSAPGRRILSTAPTYATYNSQRSSNAWTLNYFAASGTSQAAPFAAGVAALIWGIEPSLTPAQVVERIRSTADDLGSAGYDESYGTGRINAQAALALSGEAYGVTYDTSGTAIAARAGESFVGRVTVTNTSSFAWRSANPSAVRLEWSWLDSAGQPVAGLAGVMPLPADLAVGATMELVGVVAAPAQSGIHTLRFDLVRDGITTFTQKGAPPATVAVRIDGGFAGEIAPAVQTATFDSGSTGTLEVDVTNRGTVTWFAGGPNPVTLSYHWYRDGALVHWDGLRATLPSDLVTGASAKLTLPVLPPETAGTYTLRLDLVHEGVTWLSAVGVTPVDITASVRAAYVATYQTSAVPILMPGGRVQVPVKVTNTGTVAWTAGGPVPMTIAAHVFDAAGTPVIWDGARTLLPEDLAPGATLDTTVTIDAPLAAGSYRARVDVVREGVAWLSGLGVATGDIDLSVAADFRAELPTGPLTVSMADPKVEIIVRNIGFATWTVSPVAPINFSAHWYDQNGALLLWDAPRTPVGLVLPGGTFKAIVDLGTPPEGAASVQIDLVSEGVRWFGAGLVRPVTLAP